jgi:hypothetical protein
MTDQGIVVLWNCLDSQKDAPGSHSEACLSSPHSGEQAVDIKVEEFSDVEVEDDPAPMTFIGIKAEHEVSCVSVFPLLAICHSYSVLFVLFPVSKVAKKKTDGTQPLSVCCSARWQYNVTAKTDKGMVVLQKEALGLDGEVCPSSSHSGGQAVRIKVEKFLDVGGGEDSVSMTPLRMKAEYEVSHICVLPLLDISQSHPKCIFCFSSLSVMQNFSSLDFKSPF